MSAGYQKIIYASSSPAVARRHGEVACHVLIMFHRVALGSDALKTLSDTTDDEPSIVRYRA